MTWFSTAIAGNITIVFIARSFLFLHCLVLILSNFVPPWLLSLVDRFTHYSLWLSSPGLGLLPLILIFLLSVGRMQILSHGGNLLRILLSRRLAIPPIAGVPPLVHSRWLVVRRLVPRWWRHTWIPKTKGELWRGAKLRIKLHPRTLTLLELIVTSTSTSSSCSILLPSPSSAPRPIRHVFDLSKVQGHTPPIGL